MLKRYGHEIMDSILKCHIMSSDGFGFPKLFVILRIDTCKTNVYDLQLTNNKVAIIYSRSQRK